MREPEPNTAIWIEGEQVVRKAIDRWKVRLKHKSEAAGISFGVLGQGISEEKFEQKFAKELAETKAWLAAAATRMRIRERRARRRRGLMKAKRGPLGSSHFVSHVSHGKYHFVMRVILPVVLRALRAHFRARNPTVLPITKTWAIKLMARCLDASSVTRVDCEVDEDLEERLLNFDKRHRY